MREIKGGPGDLFPVDPLKVSRSSERCTRIINVAQRKGAFGTPEKAGSKDVGDLFSLYPKDQASAFILMGDFNSAPQDLSSTSVSRLWEGIPDESYHPIFQSRHTAHYNDGADYWTTGSFDLFRG